VLGATLKGTVYNSNLNAEVNVLVEVNTEPAQRFLSKDGTYSFDLPKGSYNITASKLDQRVSADIAIAQDGEYVYDLFLMPEMGTEEEFWNEVDPVVSEDILEESSPLSWWWVVLGAGILLFLGGVIYYIKKGSSVVEKPLEKGPETAEPGYLEEAISVIKKHGGRIYQTELRKEMMHLSESKISLVLTELEHKGKIEKIKKGRGNAIILK